MPTSRTLLRSSLAALAFALPLGVAAVARADVTCGDKTCPQNYECITEPNPCLDIACDGKDCAPCAGTTERCAPLPCTSDADCAADMACYTQTYQECTTPAPCAAGQDCSAPADSGCHDVTQSGCVPRYLLPCEADADCGVGFNCQTEEIVSCSGGSGTGTASSGSSGSAGGSGFAPPDDAGSPKAAADGGSADPPPPPLPDDAGAAGAGSAGDDAGAPLPPDCTTTPSDTKVCNMKVLACSVDEGCPPGWTCGANPNGVCYAGSDGSTGCSADPPLICLPPYWDLGGGARGVDSSEGTPIAVDGGVGGPTAGSSGGSTGNPNEPPKGTGAIGSGGSSGTSGATESPGTTNGASGSKVVTDDGGCAIGRGRGSLAATFGFAALAFAGLLGARRRRR